MTLPPWLGADLAALAAAAHAALAAGFVAINLGLRLLPAGRAFLGAARAEGRLFAHPGLASPAAVKAVFALAAVLALAAAVAVHGLVARAAAPVWPTGPAHAAAPVLTEATT
ncbi:hypothetical protein LNKW23_11730 [Paralimibaculum aggregatum]|uniref:Copper resistance protein D domain-containing protein n=1 Tax=Paralimibaculum aggregatum TaxID=3036245 RepID=A0ABQ6LF46_9RHOB|nr:hypothetical protein [Limibaculum sp. NKW23]GMG81960.1 hypothetical protein LNKW23_11730 [Limibaculum sp. NKW23]